MLFVLSCAAFLGACATTDSVGDETSAAAQPAAATKKLGPIWQEIPGTGFRFELLPVPGDRERGIEPCWMSKFEVTWEAFDAFVYPPIGAEDAAAVGGDAVTRPSKPYLPPDRGFGHEGFAAITMSHKNAEAFCVWLSDVSGRTFRLATEEEWEHACTAGGLSTLETADDALAHAWFAANSGGTPHAVGTKQPNAWGFYDMHGNVAEWVNGRDGKPCVKGGSYRSAFEELKASARQVETRAWNASDPQIPKSQWWLADAPFVGFRVICELEIKGVQP